MRIPDRDWKKSSYSDNDNNCVEVAFVDGGAALRDSKDPEGGSFRLPAAGWRGLLALIDEQREA